MRQFIRIKTSLLGYNKKVIEAHVEDVSEGHNKALDVLKQRVENLKDEISKLEACLSELNKERELLEGESHRFDLFIEWMSSSKTVKTSQVETRGELLEDKRDLAPDETNYIVNSQKAFVDSVDNSISRLEERITEMSAKIESLSDQIRQQSIAIQDSSNQESSNQDSSNQESSNQESIDQESKRSKLKLVEVSNSDAFKINSEPENKGIKNKKYFEKAIAELAQFESFGKEDELNDAFATQIEIYQSDEMAEEKLVALNKFVRENQDVKKVGPSAEGFWGVAVNDFYSNPLSALSEEAFDGSKNPVFSIGYNSFFEMGYTSDNIMKPLMRQKPVDKAPKQKEVYNPKPSKEVKSEPVLTKTDPAFEASNQEYKSVHKPVEGDGDLLRHKYIVGKIAGLDLYDRNGNRIIAKNEEITIEKVTIADREGKLAELIVNMVMSKSE